MANKRESDQDPEELAANGKVAVDEETGKQYVPLQKAEVELEATDNNPYHKKGSKFKASQAVAGMLVDKGFAIRLMWIVFMLSSVLATAQNVGREIVFYNPLPAGKTITSDTVTNGATNYLTTYPKSNGGAFTTTIQVVVTKISGTVGGTISLQGSLDGTNFKALNTAETQTALATITAADASAVYHWRLNGSPFTYYRVSWTGTGTMAASFSARLMSH